MVFPVRSNIECFTLKRHRYLRGVGILPTTEQGLICIILCQSLTNFYRSIVLLRLDERTGNIYILAGDELEVEVSRSGRWIFLT